MTKQEIEDKYWLEFMEWYAADPGNRYSYTRVKEGTSTYLVQYPLVDQFWMWMAAIKVPSIANGWEKL